MNIELLSAGVPVRFNVPGRYFRLIETTGPVSLTFFRRGADIAESLLVEAGYSESWLATDEGFEAVEVVSATAQAIKFAVRTESSLSYDRAVGNVAVTNNAGAVAEWNTFLLTAVPVQYRAVNVNRRFLLIQNKSVAKNLFFRIAATSGIADQYTRLAPGESFVMDNYCCSGGIFMYGDSAFLTGEMCLAEG